MFRQTHIYIIIYIYVEYIYIDRYRYRYIYIYIMYNTYILRVCPLKKVFGSPRYPLENLPAMGYVLQKICA